MKRGILYYAALLVLLVLPATALAAPRGYRSRAPLPAPYLGFFFGVSAPVDTEANGYDFGRPFNETIEFDPSVNLGGTAGFDFGMVRLEGELSYKHGEMDTVTGPADRFVAVDGRVGALALLFNAFVDLHNDSPVTPYFGGGVGFAALHISDTYGTRASTGERTLLYIDDDDDVFAYQAGAGVGIELTRLLTMDVGYRYFGTSKARFNGTDIATDLKLESHNFLLGLRFTF